MDCSDWRLPSLVEYNCKHPGLTLEGKLEAYHISKDLEGQVIMLTAIIFTHNCCSCCNNKLDLLFWNHVSCSVL